MSGDAYVPLNFLYTSAVSSAISVSITSPAPGATAPGTTTVTVSTTGAVATLQLQVDGTNVGAVVPVSSALSLDTTTLTNGSHMLTMVASDAQAHSVASAPVSIMVSNVSANSLTFVTSQTLGPLRNNYSGFVGLALTVGSSPTIVSSLGRYVAPGNGGTHLLKLVSSTGTDVAGGSASLSLAGSQPGGYAYAALPAALTLPPNTSYFLVSAETAGGDQWYDFAPVSTSTIASVTAPVYTDAGGHYVAASFASGDSYVPVNFRYQTSASSLSVIITSPATAATLSGNSISVAVSTSGTYTGLQLQVDGVNQGSSVSASPLTLNTLSLSNGSHTLTVVASGGSTTAVSPGVTVNVSNGSTGTFTSFITGETPSTLRNNYSGYVGTEIKVGATPLSVVSLGRFFVSGNSGAHTVKLVQANGTDLPGASVSVVMPGGTPGQFVYASLASPITLAANTSYFLVSQETAGGDYWYDLEPVNSTAAAQVLGATYTDAHGLYVFVGDLPTYSYVPLSFQYQ